MAYSSELLQIPMISLTIYFCHHVSIENGSFSVKIHNHFVEGHELYIPIIHGVLNRIYDFGPS